MYLLKILFPKKLFMSLIKTFSQEKQNQKKKKKKPKNEQKNIGNNLSIQNYFTLLNQSSQAFDYAIAKN